MKLLSLNIWGGKVFEELMQFLAENRDSVDIFCFQEVFHTTSEHKTIKDSHYPETARVNVFTEIQAILPDHIGHYAPAQEGFGPQGKVDFHLGYGLASFVRKDIPVKEAGDIFVFREFNARQDLGNVFTQPRNLQYLVIQDGDSQITIGNMHGLWNGGGKDDTDTRIVQSTRAKDFFNKVEGKKILCGDFNLLPDTKSLALLEDGMINLIKKYNITSTRSHYYKKEAKFADYMLVSPDVTVRDFKVLNVAVSDHLPLVLDFD